MYHIVYIHIHTHTFLQTLETNRSSDALGVPVSVESFVPGGLMSSPKWLEQQAGFSNAGWITGWLQDDTRTSRRFGATA